MNLSIAENIRIWLGLSHKYDKGKQAEDKAAAEIPKSSKVT